MTRARGLWISAALLALIGVFAWRLDWHATMQAMAMANWLILLAAVLTNLLSLALKGVRWWVCLRPAGNVPFALVMRATFAGASLNNMVIAQGGEAARVLMVSRHSGARAGAVTGALALERALDGISYLILVVVVAWSLDTIPDLILKWRAAATIALGLSIVVMFLIALRRKSVAGPAPLAFLLSLIAWALQVATYFMVARATNLPVSLGASIIAELAVGLSFLVRATPGNVGVFQAVYAGTLLPFGIPESNAVATALLIQMVQVVPVTLIGAWLSAKLLRSRPVPAAIQE